MNLTSYEIKKGVNLYYLNTNKFKTTSINFFIHRPMSRQEVTINALCSLVLRRGCPAYPKSRDLSNALSDLYGASFDTGIKKKGNNQIIGASFGFANEKYVPGKPEILKGILEIASSVVLGQKSFSEEYVNQEKENLKSLILAQKNDKRQYAQSRCLEEMCKGELYGLKRYGYVENIDEITAESLFEHYKNVVLKSGVDIFVCGDIDIDFVKDTLTKMYADAEILYTDYLPCATKKEVTEVKNITETETIAQGKLSMGFRTNVTLGDELYPALMMYNSILGGGIFSKLFNNVREKLSLCYYASSTFNGINGTMFINSGIEVKNFQKAYDEIINQINDMKNGVISDIEYTAAKLGVVNSIRSITDSGFGTADYYLGKLVGGRMISTDKLIKLVEKVTLEEIITVANKIQLDTVYFLKGSENA